MREITSHKINPLNDILKIEAVDEPDQSGANHIYQITFAGGSIALFTFQRGPINEVGLNGITNETLLAMVIDRLEGFQRGPFANEFNAAALHHLRAALEQLHERTKGRMARGVEGTNKP